MAQQQKPTFTQSENIAAKTFKAFNQKTKKYKDGDLKISLFGVSDNDESDYLNFDDTIDNPEDLKYYSQAVREQLKGTTIKTTQNYLNVLSKLAQYRNLDYNISVLFSIGWRNISNGWKNPGQRIKIKDFFNQYNAPNIKYVYGVCITTKPHIEPEETEAGANSEYNDCLYLSIRRVIGQDRMKPFTTAGRLKNFLNLDRKDKVPLKDISKIEDKLNININVYGFENPILSTKSNPQTVNLQYKDGHLKNKYNKRKGLSGIKKHKSDLKIIIYQENLDFIIYYDGITEEKTDKITFYKDIYKKHFHFYQSNTKNDIKSEYEKYKNDINEIKKDVDILKFKSISDFIKNECYYISQKLNIEPLENPLEIHFLNKCFSGGLIHCKKGKYKNVRCYDINSQYPYILQHQNFLIPTKTGKFEKLTETPKFYRFGIYRAKITGKIDDALFNVKQSNFYTSYELTRAKELNYNIELIQDGRYNFLFYDSKSRVNGSMVFKDYVKKMITLKQTFKKNQIPKMLLNRLWGLLCSKNFKITSLKTYNQSINNINFIHPSNDNKNYVVNYSPDNPFNTDLSRLSCFLTAKGRVLISSIIEKYVKDTSKIYRIHTDGFITDKNIIINKIKGLGKDELTNNELGGLKIEYEKDKIKIVNVNKII